MYLSRPIWAHWNRPFAQLWPGNKVRGIVGENRLRCVCFSLGTFCKTKIAIFVKARGRGAKKMAHVREYPHESSCGRPSSRTIFRFEIGLSWGESSGSAGSERWFGWFFPFNWICQHFFPIEIWTSVMFTWSTFGLWWVACRMAFWTWCSTRRRPSIQFELAMDLILRLRVGRAHQLFFVDVTVFMREQSEKREVRKSSTTTEQETTLKSWSQKVQTTRLDRPVKTSHTTCRQGHDQQSDRTETSIFCLQNDATVRRTFTTFVCPQTQFHENLHTNFALQNLPIRAFVFLLLLNVVQRSLWYQVSGIRYLLHYSLWNGNAAAKLRETKLNRER